VRRKELGRDLGLSIRMLAVTVVLAGLYVGVALLIAIAVWADWDEDWRVFLLPPAFLLLLWVHYVSADRLVLGAAHANVVDPARAPELHAIVERLCGVADLPKPKIAIGRLKVPNAFAAGITHARSTIVVTTGLRDRLTKPELEAVVAHEVAHLANRDAVVMTAASAFPVAAAFFLRRRFGPYAFERDELDFEERLAFKLFSPFAWVLYIVGFLLTVTISRYREYAADRGAAILTGAPEQLMSALQKLSDETDRIPSRDLRALTGLNAFFIVPAATHSARFTVLRDHPPLEKRLRRLAAISRELGKAAA